MKSEKRAVYENALKIAVDTMDGREKVKQMILDLNAKGLKIPDEYKTVDVLEPHWRKQRGIMRRLKQFAKQCARNYKCKK